MNQDITAKEIIQQMINICTRVVTLIFLISTILISLLNGTPVNYRSIDIFYIILVGVISGVSFIIFYIPKNISKKMMILLQICYFAIINFSVLFIGVKLEWFDISNKLSTIVMEAMIIGIYVIVYILCLVFDFRQASKMNYLLDLRKKKNLEEK